MDWCILNVAIDSIYVLKTDIFNQSFVFLLLQDLQFDISLTDEKVFLPFF